jgi:hypothetical protein
LIRGMPLVNLHLQAFKGQIFKPVISFGRP